MDADAVVIGAGAAGLAAARRLAENSLRVIVLEARNRSGGRVWSHATPRAAIPAELGAEFIHGRAPQTMALLREAGMAAIDTGGETWTASAGELRRADDGFMTAAGIFEGAKSLLIDESADRFLRRFEGEASMRATTEAARAFVEGFEAADPAIASAKAIGDEWASGVDSTTARPLGGYRPVFELLRNACVTAGVQMHLSTVVRRISWHRGAVSVDVKDPAGQERTISARAAVVTLPVGVLRHRGDATAVAFEPGLPPAKRVALGNLEMGHAVRVALWFRTPFWERIHEERYKDAAFFRSASRPFAAYWAQLPVRSESIVAWVGGPNAAALTGIAKTDVIERAINGFGSMLGNRALAREELEEGFTHDWGTDPFARGAYSYVAVGGSGARAALAVPLDDTLFFAGEATSRNGQGGTVNGALETGMRAAGEIVTSLGIAAGSSNG